MKIKNVCDVCSNSRRKVKSYRVGQDGDNVKVDLCAEHAEPLERLLKLGERIPNASPRVKVWSMDEIDKEARRQRTRKHPPGQ